MKNRTKSLDLLYELAQNISAKDAALLAHFIESACTDKELVIMSEAFQNEMMPSKLCSFDILPDFKLEYGFYGKWDYPHAQWKQIPTISDVSDIMNQKSQRDPRNALWQNRERCIEWLKSHEYL